jgi:hypothetical protein
VNYGTFGKTDDLLPSLLPCEILAKLFSIAAQVLVPGTPVAAPTGDPRITYYLTHPFSLEMSEGELKLCECVCVDSDSEVIGVWLGCALVGIAPNSKHAKNIPFVLSSLDVKVLKRSYWKLAVVNLLLFSLQHVLTLYFCVVVFSAPRLYC